MEKRTDRNASTRARLLLCFSIGMAIPQLGHRHEVCVFFFAQFLQFLFNFARNQFDLRIYIYEEGNNKNEGGDNKYKKKYLVQSV